MSLNINQKININAVKTESKQEPQKEEIQNKEENKAKEHCSSKAGKAIRGLALGLMLASAAAGVCASKANQPPAQDKQNIDNTTNVTQEYTQNTEKTDIEKIVDEAIDDNETKESNIYAGGMLLNCSGDMKSIFHDGGRNFEKAEVTKDGQLVFYDKQFRGTGIGGGNRYIAVGSFDLGSEVNGKTITLQPGTRFEETTENRGDYVILSKDGRTFEVYDRDDNCIGSCKAESTSSVKIKMAIGIAATAGAFGPAPIKYFIESRKFKKMYSDE